MLNACNILEDGSYRYMSDLQALDREYPSASSSHQLSDWDTVKTPLIPFAWAKHLTGHPDSAFRAYIANGVRYGFRIGYRRTDKHLTSSRRNLMSAYSNPSVINKYLADECSQGRLLGPFPPESLKSWIHISPFGVIPKKNRPNKWRLIVDLSSPKPGSINEGISPDLCSLHYSGLDEAISIVKRLGPNCLLAKLDLQSAYRVVPIHPQDRHLLGVKWKDQIYLDIVLPFGLRSAPKIFSALADALLFIMAQHGVDNSIHYLDDFLFVGTPDCEECANHLATALRICIKLGFPVAPEKIEGPSTSLVFLGITIDSATGEVRLPESKLLALQSELALWSERKSCTKKQLLSLIGSLQHATSVVKSGRPFLRRLIDLSMVVSKLHHSLRLNVDARSDIAWWRTFLPMWNGKSFFRFSKQLELTSDASGSWGCGAFCGNQWLQLHWRAASFTASIATKELVPIVLAAAVWGSQWSASHILCKCDNAAVVAVINKGSCRDQSLMHLMRCLTFYAAVFNFSISAVHLPGSQNTAADALSRGDRAKFFSVLPQANPIGTPIPAAVVDMTLLSKPDWTSPHWRALFNATLAMA